MKRFFILTSYVIFSTILVSCNDHKKINNKTNINLESTSNIKNNDNLNNSCEYTFILNDEELKYYNILSETLSMDSFKNINPISLAKIYMFCGINQNWKAEYAMINKNILKKSLEEWISYNEKEFQKVDTKYIRERAESIASHIDEGKFIDDNKFPYILFNTISGDKMKFQFIKTDNDKLEISVPPISYIE